MKKITIVLALFMSFSLCLRAQNQNTALHINGSSTEYATIPTTTRLSGITEGTVMFWTNVDSLPTAYGSFLNSQKVGIFMNELSGKKVYVYMNNDQGQMSTFYSQPVMSFNNWIHVAVTFKANDLCKVYINGEESASGALADGTYSLSNIFLGKASNNSDFLHGYLDELSVWSAALTAQQIRESMHKTFAGDENDLVLYYPFDENDIQPNVFHDVANNIDGTIYGGQPVTVALPVTPVAITGKATSAYVSQVAGGTIMHSRAAITLTDDFDNPVDVCITQVNTAPYEEASKGSKIPDGMYWVVNAFGNAGTYKYDMRVVVDYARYLEKAYLYTRSFNSASEWRLVSGINYTDITSDTLTFHDVDTVGQFVVVAFKPYAMSNLNPGMSLVFKDSLSIDFGEDGFHFLGNDPFTIETWIKTTHTGSRMQLYSSGDPSYLNGAVWFYINSDGKLAADLAYSPGPVGTTTLTDGMWHHVALVNKEDTFILYVDGMEEGRNAMRPNIVSNIHGSVTAIGSAMDLNRDKFYYEGEMDEMRIWGASLSVEELRLHEHGVRLSGRSNLLSYYQFDNAPGEDLIGSLFGSAIKGSVRDAAVELKTSTAPFGGMYADIFPEIVSGTHVLGDFTFQQTNDFDNPVMMSITQIDALPVLVPSIGSVYSHGYWIMDVYGQPGTFAGDITLAFHRLPAIDMHYLKLFNRPANSDTAWTYLGTADDFSAFSVTFRNITTDGQFILVYDPPVGVNEIAAQKQVSVYPNPVSNILTVITEQEGTIKIINVQGQTVYATGLAAMQHKIDMEAFAPGVYFLQVNTSQGIHFTKLVKE